MTTKKKATKWKPDKIEKGLFLKIKEQADALPDGWLEIEVPECDETQAPAFKVKVARIPFERWLRGTFQHRRKEWTNISPMGFKGYSMDDRDHTDWWISSGLPAAYAYGRKQPSYKDWLDEDDPEYVPAPTNQAELINKSKRLLDHSWIMRIESANNRVRNSIFLASSKKKIEGYVFHVNSPDDIPEFVEEAKRWKKASNSCDMIAVVPDCSVKYDLVIRHAGAIISVVGSAAAHLVKVAREDKVPVIMCPDAFTEYLHGERIKIENKDIRGKF